LYVFLFPTVIRSQNWLIAFFLFKLWIIVIYCLSLLRLFNIMSSHGDFYLNKTRPRGQRCVLGIKRDIDKEQDPEVNDASSSHFFIFHFFFNFFIVSLSSSLLPPRRSFLLAPASSSSLLPPCSSFFLFQHCLNHLESIKGRFSSILTKALRTDGPTDQPTNGRTDKASYRDARTHLKRISPKRPSGWIASSDKTTNRPSLMEARGHQKFF
jgi:hypothetical protein